MLQAVVTYRITLTTSLSKNHYLLHRFGPLKVVGAALCGDPVLRRTARYGDNAQTREQFYSLVLPIHLERAGLRADSYLD